MKLFAIFGDPVAHSRSPLMHNHVFKSLDFPACYTRVHLKKGSELKETFFRLGLSGANVTVPHKEAAFAACDEIRGFAQQVGVVNTLINENGRLIGYNTDADGFMFAIEPFGSIKTVLIIGAGGTAKALASKFQESGLETTVLNRSEGRLDYFKEKGFQTHSWETIPTEAYDLIVNTTSAGLEDDNLPAPETLVRPLLQKCRFAADAIYGKLTPFLQLASEMGIKYKDGSDMLLGQGVLANEYFTGGCLAREAIKNVMRQTFEF
ncbi:MAG: shikimate dehydrogenase [Campylobacterota bacterium]|nr:shikimate dehydrogenase [Campylobacterota bacterium]